MKITKLIKNREKNPELYNPDKINKLEKFSKIKIDIYLTKGLFATIQYKVDDDNNEWHQ